MGFVVTILFWLFFAATCPVGLLLGFVLFLLSRPFDPNRTVVHHFACWWTFGHLRLNPAWRIQILHRERLPRSPCVLVANHQSMADIVVAMGLSYPFKFASKASVFSVPVVGWMMRLAGYVSVERGRPHSIWKMLEDCRIWLRRGVAVLLYPEGTYSQDGALLPFKRGAFRLAIEQQVPVVPVIIEGTRGLIDGDGPWLNPSCQIRVTVMPPISVAELGSDDAELATRARRVFERVFQQ